MASVLSCGKCYTDHIHQKHVKAMDDLYFFGLHLKNLGGW